MKLFIKKKQTKKGITESLWIDFTHNGKRHRKSLGLKNTSTNRKHAKQRLIPELQIKLLSGEFFDKTKMPTVSEYMEISFQLREGSRTKSTIYGHRKNYERYIEPIFGSMKIDTLTSRKITIWQNNLVKQGLAKATIDKIRGLLYSMYEDSIEEGFLIKNPISNVKRVSTNIKPKQPTREIDPFSKSEIQRIISAEEGQTQNLYALLFFSGVRIGEAIGLTWRDIDFENNVLKIRRQVRFGESTPLKTQNSIRDIPIIDVLKPFLENQFNLTGKSDSYVFLNKQGTQFYSSNKVREQFWIKTFEKVNIPYRNLHQTRHTYISNLISSGEDINYVSMIAGHKNTKVTLEKYSRYIPHNNSEFGKTFKNLFG